MDVKGLARCLDGIWISTFKLRVNLQRLDKYGGPINLCGRGSTGEASRLSKWTLEAMARDCHVWVRCKGILVHAWSTKFFEFLVGRVVVNEYLRTEQGCGVVTSLANHAEGPLDMDLLETLTVINNSEMYVGGHNRVAGCVPHVAHTHGSNRPGCAHDLITLGVVEKLLTNLPDDVVGNDDETCRNLHVLGMFVMDEHLRIEQVLQEKDHVARMSRDHIGLGPV
ncbi:hypothetical protein VNO78_29078 [Psophocarpus tetragonolobus]|uniref:Uncharacterized protein n=1 Tax=Psophocarpus tetragonolobus TaxID=3891 RepID=A0AAN9X0H3_PSOTE